MAGERGLPRDRKADHARSDNQNLHRYPGRKMDRTRFRYSRICRSKMVASANPVQSIKPLRRANEQVGLLGSARALRQNLAGVPEHRVAVRALVDREVALEHCA